MARSAQDEKNIALMTQTLSAAGWSSGTKQELYGMGAAELTTPHGRLELELDTSDKNWMALHFWTPGGGESVYVGTPFGRRLEELLAFYVSVQNDLSAETFRAHALQLVTAFSGTIGSRGQDGDALELAPFFVDVDPTFARDMKTVTDTLLSAGWEGLDNFTFLGTTDLYFTNSQYTLIVYLNAEPRSLRFEYADHGDEAILWATTPYGDRLEELLALYISLQNTITPSTSEEIANSIARAFEGSDVGADYYPGE